MKFRLRMMLCIVMLLALVFGAGGSILISVSFSQSMAGQRDMALKNYRMLQTTMVLANSISAQTGYEDLVSTLRQLDGQSGAPWRGLRLTDGTVTMYDSGALPFSDSAAVGGEAGRCYIRLFENDGVGTVQVSGVLQVNEAAVYLDVGYDVSHLYAIRQNQLDIYYRLLAAVVGLGRPETFPDGAATGTPAAAMISRQTR